MEEKKLTNDTEIDVGMIVKAFECCMNDTCDKCPFGEVECNALVCERFVNEKTLDLIRRLQDENERLENKNSVLMAMNKGLKAQHKAEVKQIGEQIKMAFYYEFDELIPSIMADKIDEIVGKVK